jgi:hypothetical protein
MTALTIFSIDRLFDMMSDKGTEYLEAQLAKADADVTLVGQLATVIDRQFAQSQMYAQLAQENQAVLSAYTRNERSIANAVELARSTGGLRADTVAIIEAARARRQSAQAALGDLLNQCSIN